MWKIILFKLFAVATCSLIFLFLRNILYCAVLPELKTSCITAFENVFIDALEISKHLRPLTIARMYCSNLAVGYMVSRCFANCIPLHLRLCLNSKKFVSSVFLLYLFCSIAYFTPFDSLL